jgi:hypothetical protein
MQWQHSGVNLVPLYFYKTLKINFMSTIQNSKEEKEIIENNKLIAEFMGGKYSKDVSFPMSNDSIWLPFWGIINFETIENGKGQVLLYHSSWDWLMPVVERVVKLKIGDGVVYVDHPYLRTFGATNEATGKIMVRFNGQALFQSDTLIEATYLAVIDIINWYNGYGNLNFKTA